MSRGDAPLSGALVKTVQTNKNTNKYDTWLFSLNTRYILLNGVSGCNVEPCTFFPTTKRHKCLIPSDTYWSTIVV